MPIKPKKKRPAEGAAKQAPQKATKGSFFGKTKGYFSEQGRKIRSDQKKQFLFFVLGFLVFYLVISGIVFLFPEDSFKSATGKTLVSLLSAQGLSPKEIGMVSCSESNWVGMDIQSTCYSFSTGGKQVVISWLCTGVLEIIILVSAVLASFGINWKKKLLGAAIAVIAGVIFNLLRLVVTVNIILSQNIQTIELAHDLLFRIVLFAYITGFYVVWFYYASNDGKRGGR